MLSYRLNIFRVREAAALAPRRRRRAARKIGAAAASTKKSNSIKYALLPSKKKRNFDCRRSSTD